MSKESLAWQYRTKNEPNPYQLEWNHLIAAIRDNEPYNEVERGVQASVVTSMGVWRLTRVEISYEDMLNWLT